MRPPELDEKAVEVQPFPMDRFSDGLSDVDTGIYKSKAVEDMN